MENKYLMLFGLLLVAVVLFGCASQSQGTQKASIPTPPVVNGVSTISWAEIPTADTYLITVFTSRDAQLAGQPAVAGGTTTNTSIGFDQLTGSTSSGSSYWVIIQGLRGPYTPGQPTSFVGSKTLTVIKA